MNVTVYRTIFIKAIWCVFHLFGQKLFSKYFRSISGSCPLPSIVPAIYKNFSLCGKQAAPSGIYPDQTHMNFVSLLSHMVRI